MMCRNGTLGGRKMMIDRAAGFGILAIGLATALSLAPAAVVKAQVIIQPDRLESGATTPEKLNKQIRHGAATQQASGTPAATAVSSMRR